VASPKPDKGTRKFTTLFVDYDTSTSHTLKKLLSSFQDFLYDTDSDSYRYGGGAGFGSKSSSISGIYLGSAQETVDLFKNYGLMSNTMLSNNTAYYSKGYEVVDPVKGYPSHGIELSEFDSYGEAMLFKLCTQFSQKNPHSYNMVTSMDWCKDMNLDSNLCQEVTVEFPPLPDVQVNLPKNCLDKTVIKAMAKNMLDPKSFMNRAGWEKQWQDAGKSAFVLFCCMNSCVYYCTNKSYLPSLSTFKNCETRIFQVTLGGLPLWQGVFSYRRWILISYTSWHQR
jgi:hypothetical protein